MFALKSCHDNALRRNWISTTTIEFNPSAHRDGTDATQVFNEARLGSDISREAVATLSPEASDPG